MTTRSVNFNYQLIDLVESNPVLYDMSRVWYKDDTHKQAIWMDIAKTLNESGKDQDIGQRPTFI